MVEGGTRGPFAESSRLTYDTRNAIARIAGIAEAGAVTYQSVQIETDGRRQRLFVIGYEPGRPGQPHGVIEGHPIDRSHFQLIADRRSGLALGSTLRLGGDDFTIVGRTAGHVDSAGNPVIYMTLKDAQKLQFQLLGGAARQQAARGESANRNQVNAILARLPPMATSPPPSPPSNAGSICPPCRNKTRKTCCWARWSIKPANRSACSPWSC